MTKHTQKLPILDGKFLQNHSAIYPNRWSAIDLDILGRFAESKAASIERSLSKRGVPDRVINDSMAFIRSAIGNLNSIAYNAIAGGMCAAVERHCEGCAVDLETYVEWCLITLTRFVGKHKLLKEELEYINRRYGN